MSRNDELSEFSWNEWQRDSHWFDERMRKTWLWMRGWISVTRLVSKWIYEPIDSTKVFELQTLSVKCMIRPIFRRSFDSNLCFKEILSRYHRGGPLNYEMIKIIYFLWRNVLRRTLTSRRKSQQINCLPLCQ